MHISPGAIAGPLLVPHIYFSSVYSLHIPDIDEALIFFNEKARSMKLLLNHFSIILLKHVMLEFQPLYILYVYARARIQH